MSKSTWVALLAIAFWAVSARSIPAEYDPTFKETYRVDGLGRVLEVGGRDAMPCLKQSGNTAVLLIAGQSNSANSGQQKFSTARPNQVTNYHAGKCYPAISPLVGTNGFGGESWTPLADKLIDGRVFDQVVLVTTGIGGTEIARWREGGDLNRMLRDVVADVAKRYRVTHVLWHQGESDLGRKTSGEEYAAGFMSFVDSLRQAGIAAPVFVSIASKCGQVESWNEADSVTQAQRSLPDSSKGIFEGPDTNSLIPPTDRYDKCHFAKAGQEKFADAWVSILKEHAPSNHETEPADGRNHKN